MANIAAFYETRDYLRNLVEYVEPLSFDEWAKVPDDKKAAYLFIQFFNEITLAWDKANNFDQVEGEQGVTTMMQYLQKQVGDWYIKGHPKKKVSYAYFCSHRDECDERHIIPDDPKKFTPNYIYTIAYNCLYCICHDLKSVQDIWNNETSGVVSCGDSEIDLISSSPYNGGESAEDCYCKESMSKEFWSMIEDTDLSTRKVMRYLLSGNPADLKKVSKNNPNYNSDPLRDIEVSLDLVGDILDNLRNKLESTSINSACGSYIAQVKAEMAQ